MQLPLSIFNLYPHTKLTYPWPKKLGPLGHFLLHQLIISDFPHSSRCEPRESCWCNSHGWHGKLEYLFTLAAFYIIWRKSIYCQSSNSQMGGSKEPYQGLCFHLCTSVWVFYCYELNYQKSHALRQHMSMISVSMDQELAMLAEAFFQILTRLKSVCPLAMSPSSSSIKEICASKSLRLLAGFTYLGPCAWGPLFLLAIGWGALPTPREYSQVFATWPSP